MGNKLKKSIDKATLKRSQKEVQELKQKFSDKTFSAETLIEKANAEAKAKAPVSEEHMQKLRAAALEVSKRNPYTTDGRVVMVREFMKKHEEFMQDTPAMPDKGICLYRLNLLKSEVEELKEAIEEMDLVKVLDALTDIDYILAGTKIAFGLGDLSMLSFMEVHGSNMSKENVDGVITKGKTYNPPNLKQTLTMFYGPQVLTKKHDGEKQDSHQTGEQG